ncbi:MAG: ABC transporter ATP-binding protein [Microbacteriaceae bacterium]
MQISRVFEMPAERVFGVRDVSLTVRQGDFVCLMGPSGCGKSTLLSLLAGLDVPTGGRVLFGGQDLSGTSAEDRAAVRLREIGMVFQDHQLIPEFTAVENVMLPLELQGQHHDEAEAAAGEALDRVGLKDLAHRFPSELSGGQRQRIGLARAIVGTRRAVLADEATGSLDHENSKMVFQLLRDLAAQGYAVLAATHDPLAAKFADRTLRMIDGSLSESEVTTVGEHER